MRDIAITVSDINYRYPDGSVALNSISLEVFKDEKVAILGPNGAGKSTLLMHLAGILRPSQGMISILGMKVNDKNIHEIRRNVGMAFQNPDDQLFCSTVYEDVSYGLLNLGLPKDEIALRTKEALRQVGLEGYEDRPPHRLSEGEKKKVAIATVLCMRPKIIIIDEPTANLDPKSRLELIDLIRNLRNEFSFTLVIATHDVDLIPPIADRIFILNKGQIIADGSVKEIFLNANLLNKAKLEPPVSFKLFQLINEIDPQKSFPLTIEDALDKIQSLIRPKSSD